jgi:hypothetical protein
MYALARLLVILGLLVLWVESQAPTKPLCTYLLRWISSRLLGFNWSLICHSYNIDL